MFMKSSIFVVLVLAVATSSKRIRGRSDVIVSSVGNDLFIGGRVEGDYQVTQYGVRKSAEENEVVTTNLVINAAYEITYIAAFDKSGNELSGNVPTLVSGGPGENDAELSFTSLPGQEINYWVDVYVRR